ncbi:MAG: septal ring lytic transglycosylase RlpA family protein [Deltaproteobacteria bacterium]|nr:septal ring lytic transglycosylase RlpA family protein [Deltaproteobacteria bacterium]MBI2538955.1 septal ring lytic transglycosylase RlpA family protein [Deltaproteobacteria bacterium]
MPPLSGQAFQWLWLASTLFFFSTACSLPPAKVKVPAPASTEGGATQTGIASWYGPGFHGRPTASGVIYNQNDLTAAHQTLPLGTRVMVTNLANGRSAEVTINDRGPFAKGRIVDLSYAAARTLGMIGPGTIPVRIEVIDSGPYRIQSIRPSLDYTLQAGSFVELENAQRLKEHLAKSYPRVPDVTIVPVHGKDSIHYRVQLGTFSNRRDAEGHAQQLARKGFPIIIMEK